MGTAENTDDAPLAGEGLAAYVRRLREGRKLTQSALAERAGVHLQTSRKIERGVTESLRPKAKGGIARTLAIAEDYLEAAERGVAAKDVATLKRVHLTCLMSTNTQLCFCLSDARRH